MKLKELESYLQNVKSFENAKLNYEQYITTPHLASQIVFAMQHTYEDIEDLSICDLGIGTGMLSIGCSLSGSLSQIGVDIDPDALKICQENLDYFEIENIGLINADCKQLLHMSEKAILFDKKFDTVIMNPPFGTKFQSKINPSTDLGIDMQFLKLASKISDHAIYSLNKTATRSFIQKVSKKWGLKMEVVSELRYNIPKVEKGSRYQASSKPDKDIEVDFLRFTIE